MPGKMGSVDLARLLNLDSATTDSNVAATAVQEARARAARGELEVLTSSELSFSDGSRQSRAVLVSVDNIVFDVSAARNQYAPQVSYNSLAGREISRALTLSSLDAKDMSDDTTGLSDIQRATRARWILFFAVKYPIVAVLGSVNHAVQAPSCSASPPLSDTHIEARGTLAAVTLSGAVVDVSSAQWLYGTQGVRYGLSPPNPAMYMCIGRKE